jgi:hypothetical protein
LACRSFPFDYFVNAAAFAVACRFFQRPTLKMDMGSGIQSDAVEEADVLKRADTQPFQGNGAQNRDRLVRHHQAFLQDFDYFRWQLCFMVAAVRFVKRKSP